MQRPTTPQKPHPQMHQIKAFTETQTLTNPLLPWSLKQRIQ